VLWSAAIPAEGYGWRGVGLGSARQFKPPRALGVLRSAYSPALKGAVRAEIDKDLVAVPVHEIEKRLTAA
jgi:hypothetical protein